MACIRSTFVAFFLSALAILGAGAAAAQPTFSKVFNPSTVGPNGTTGLTYTIDNSSGSAITSMNFANTLPAGLTVAGPAQTDCSDAALSAAGSSVSLTSARLFAGGICTVSVPIAVANAGPATITNPAVTLNNNVGAVSSVARDLTVDTGRAGFSKVFAPDTITVGQTTRLTYTVDNTANSSQGISLTFQDNLPNGLAVADPPNATHNCTASVFTGGTFAPVAGSQAIAATNGGGVATFAVAAGASCTFAVDVTGTAAGSYVSQSDSLSGTYPSFLLLAGPAIDSITVTGASAGQLAIVKDYTNDPVGPGGNVTLRFDLTNTDRSFPASNVAFADNLAAQLTGATVSSVVSNTCGGSVSGTGTGSVGLSGGNIAAQGSCRVEIGIDIPSSATPGSYTTTLDSASASVNGSSVSGNLPAAQLTISNASPLVFTKSVVGSSTLAPGDTLTFRYEINNPNGSGIDFSNVTFTDPYENIFGTLVNATIPSVAASNCGAPTVTQTFLSGGVGAAVWFLGGTVVGGQTCTFDVSYVIPSDFPSGTVTSPTNALSGENGGQTIFTPGASASFTVNGGAVLRFSKAFASASATAGSSVDLTFTITSEPESTSNVTGLTFTDDLGAFVTGAVATGLPLSNVCGTGSQITGTSTLTLTGGNLTPGTSCTITVPVSIPVSATTAEATNTTSNLTGTVTTGGGALNIAPATATLDVLGLDDQPLTLAAEFLPSTNVPGGTGTLRYTINNPNTSSAGTITFFTHNLQASLAGLASTNATSPSVNTCSSSVSGTTFIIVTGGSVAAGASCVIEIDYLVPGGAASGDYGTPTSVLASDVGGSKTSDAAAPSLTIVADPLTATKSFNVTTAGATDTVVVTVELANAVAPTTAATAVSFTDDLENNFLTGAVGTGQVSNSCGGTLNATGSTVSLSGGSFAGSTCTVQYNVQLPASPTAGSYTNTISDIAATIGSPITGVTASASLQVTAAPTGNADLSISMTDGVTSAAPGETVTYTIVAGNSGPATAATASVATTFDSDLTCTYTAVDNARVTGETLSGSGNISDTLNIPTGEQVTYTASCAVSPSATGTLSSAATISDLSVTDPVAANNSASDTDTTLVAFVNAFATITDGATEVGAGGTVTYTVVASNAGPTTDPSVTFSSSFDALLTGCSYTAVAAGGASGQTGSGSGNISDTLSLPPNATVTYTAQCQVPTGTANGTSLSSSATATASLNDTVAADNTASDTDTSVIRNADVYVTKAASAAIAGFNVTYTIVAGNNGPTDDSNVGLVDNFPAPLTSCNYTSVAAGGASGNTASGSGNIAETLSLPSGSTVTYTATCSVPAAATGSIANTATVTPSEPDSVTSNNSATDNSTIVSSVDLVVTKVFNPSTIAQGGTTVATVTIDNSGNTSTASNIAFTDTLPGGLRVASAPNQNTTCGTGGVVSANAGDSTFSLASGEVAGGASCTVTVTLVASTPGTLTNAAFNVTSSIATGQSTAVDLTVAAAPGFTKAFDPANVNIGEVSKLTFTIDNSTAGLAATGLSFTDTFPAGMVVSATPNASNTCGGTFTATALQPSVSLAGGTVAAGAICKLTVDVRATSAGSLANTSGDLTSSLGTSTGASATLTSAPIVINIGAEFQPSQIELFEVTDLVYTFTNGASLDQLITFVENLPSGLVVGKVTQSSGVSAGATAISAPVKYTNLGPAAIPGLVPASTPATVQAQASTTCTGGTLTAIQGGTQISYTGGSAPANGSCQVRVQVTPTAVGNFSSITGGAPLAVTAATRGFVTFQVSTTADGVFKYASSNSDFTFDLTSTNGSGSQGPITTTAGSYSVTVTPPVGVAITEMSCSDSDSTADAATMTYSVNLAVLETVTCTLKAESSVQKTVDTINTFLTKRADLILSTEPSSGRRLDRLNRGFGEASPLTFANGDLRSMLPFAARGTNGNYSFTTSLVQMREAAASARLAHGSHKDVEYVENYRFDAWFEAHYKEFETGSETGTFLAAHAGLDYLLSKDVLVGVMASFDRMNESSSAAVTTVSGDGWMVGPYITARLSPNLYFDGRIAGGASTNLVSPFNTYTDTFHTKRMLAMAALSGEFQQGNWTISPNASLSYFRENQESYTDTTGATIPSQTVTLGQIKIGPTFTGRFEGDNGEVYAPYFGADLLYNIGSTTGVTLTNPSSASTDGWRGRVQAGLKMTDDSGIALGFGASYDGIGRSDFSAWGLTFDLKIPFYKPSIQ